MPLTCQQIVNMACQMAHATGYTSQAGQLLNSILSELAQNYDLDANQRQSTITLGSSAGSGPYSLPSDYLRMCANEVRYYINGTPYVMKNIDMAEFEALVQQAGLYGYPESFATDNSQTPQAMYVWPPAGGAYVVNFRYYCQPADIATPETSTAVPWFENTNYLLARLAGQLCHLTDDERAQMFLGESEVGAQGILTRYLKMQEDNEGRAVVVGLDRRRFSKMGRLPDTKNIGW